jgi:hypothetical protein
MSLSPERLPMDVLLDRALQTGGETDGFELGQSASIGLVARRTSRLKMHVDCESSFA